MHRDSYWRSGVILRTALSAVEAAMLDIKGKALGVPVYELLGGRCRDRVKCYANGWFAGARSPLQFAEKARAAVELGFRALKFDPFGSAYRTLEPAERTRAIQIVEAVRDSVGPDVDLLIEVHGRLDVPNAIVMARELERFKPFWYEEPVAPDNLSALAEVRNRIHIPVAAGERFYDVTRFADAFWHKALDVAQPDVCHVGGILECKRVASLAMVHEKSISPHNPNGPVCNAMSLHLVASTPNCCMLETMASDVPWRAQVAAESLVLEDGFMLVPDRPGLGVDVDEECAAQFPYEPCDLRHYKAGALTDIRPPDARPYYTIRTSHVPAGR
jgi:galactonate dehydratase